MYTFIELSYFIRRSKLYSKGQWREQVHASLEHIIDRRKHRLNDLNHRR
jgi:hypothetical protein